MASELAERYTKGSFYLWTPMRNGGETIDAPTPTGGTRRVVQSRNIIEVGTKVTQKDLDATDEQWMEWVDGGSIRSYPFPPDLSPTSTDSPLVHLQKKVKRAAQSEEERLMAAVEGATTTEESLVEAAAEVDKEEKSKDK